MIDLYKKLELSGVLQSIFCDLNVVSNQLSAYFNLKICTIMLEVKNLITPSAATHALPCEVNKKNAYDYLNEK